MSPPVSTGSPIFWFLAFGAGILSFTSPCILPLLPGYLSYMSGVSTDDATERGGRILLASVLFVAGFAVVFTALGATASLAGSLVIENRATLLRISGGFIILMGLITLGVLKIPALYVERRFHVRPNIGPLGALPLGMAFAFGWTPCIGPVLASIDAVAGSTGSVRTGAGMLFVYALGLGLPFIVTAFMLGRGISATRWLRRFSPALNVLGGVVLLAMGGLLLLGQWVQMMSPVLRLYSRLNWPIL